MTRHHRMCFSALGTVALALAAHGAWAQQMYRHVAPDGRVSYSDQPPVASSSSPATGRIRSTIRSGSRRMRRCSTS